MNPKHVYIQKTNEKTFLFCFSQQEKIKRIQQIRMEKELRAQQILEVTESDPTAPDKAEHSWVAAAPLTAV